MSAETAIISLASVAIGVIFCFAGYRLFRIIIAIWGFFAGFFIGGQITSTFLGGAFLANPLAWGAGIALGIILAFLAYALYLAAVAILGASVGYLIGIGLAMAFGASSQAGVTFLVGVLMAALFGALILLLNLAKALIIINTALGGASAIVLGILLLLGFIALSSLNAGPIGAFLKSSPGWGLAWLALAMLGFMFQLQNTRHYRLEKYKLANKARIIRPG